MQDLAIQTADADNGDYTVGTYDGDAQIGDVVTVKLHDSNGMPIEATGTVVDILS